LLPNESAFQHTRVPMRKEGRNRSGSAKNKHFRATECRKLKPYSFLKVRLVAGPLEVDSVG